LRHQVRALGPADGVGGRDLVGCLVQDLRNGLQIAAGEAGVRIEDPEVRNNDILAHWVHACAQG
jgi:hypothetical protein